MADVGVFSRYKGFADFQEEARKTGLAEALTMAQIKKAQELDLDKVGEVAFAKAAQGIPLSPLEQAGAQYLNNKSGGVTMDVTGNLIQKPKLFDGINMGIPQATSTSPAFSSAMKAPVPSSGGDLNSLLGGPDILAGESPVGETITPTSVGNEWDLEFQKQYGQLEGNPKAQQDLLQAYSKSKIEMNADQSKNAGFADRMASSNPLIEQYAPAALDNTNVRLDRNLPDFIANRVVSKDYQSFNQAQRDFINAQLRRESGAVIADSEFDNAAKQYFPQVGDSPQVLLQKKSNRDSAFKSMQRSAGPAYKAPAISPVEAKGKAAFEAKKPKPRLKYNPATGDFE